MKIIFVNSAYRSQLSHGFFFVVSVFLWFALVPQGRATCQEACLTKSNTVLGENALINNTGSENTAIGFQALFANTTGNFNTASGYEALFSNTIGSNNTANGTGALQVNKSGAENTATGVDALFANTVGINNTATGAFALAANTTGVDNTATGEEALESNTTGHDNTAAGVSALRINTTGSNNIAIGSGAGQNLTTGSNNVDIGNAGVAGEANAIRIGTPGTQTAAFIAGIRGVTVVGTQPVLVNASGQLGVKASSARFKDAIAPMNKASEAILALHPVIFRYKKALDPSGMPQFGLIAEDVAKVNPALVVADEKGKPMTVRYEEINAMLLNEFLKEHRKVQELEAALATINEQLKAQEAKIDGVNAKVEMSKPSPQMVANDW